MKLTLLLWTAAAVAAVAVQLLAAAPLEMEEKELEEDALVEVERREWVWEDQQEMIVLEALRDAFDSLFHYAKRLQRQKAQRRGQGRRRKGQYRYDKLPSKRLLERKGGDAEELADEQDDVARCRDFLNSGKFHDAAGKAEKEGQQQVDGKQEEVQKEGKQDENKEEEDLKDLLQREKLLANCLELLS